MTTAAGTGKQGRERDGDGPALAAGLNSPWDLLVVGDRMFVAEAYLRSPERLARYVRPDELHTTFNFNLLHSPFDAAAFRAAIDGSRRELAKVGAPPTWVLASHDVTRAPTKHVAFGFGEHYCLGVHLARLEGRIFFEELIDTFSSIERAGEPTKIWSNFNNGLDHLPVRLTR